MNVLEQCENAKLSALQLLNFNSEAKKFVLFELADDLEANSGKILKANEKDLRQNKGKISEALLKRLAVDKKKIKDMALMVRSVAKLEDPTHKLISEAQLSQGLTLKKISVPIGVICCIFESRPEVMVQISALAIKSANAVLLKGGSEAGNTNKALAEIIRNSIKDNKGLPVDAVQLLETREQIKEILKMDEFISLIIPRGSNQLVKYIQSNTRIPVLGHAEGICHVYIDKDADLKKATDIAYDAKCQYPAVCNAMETLLVNKAIAKDFLPLILKRYLESGVEVRADAETLSISKRSVDKEGLKKLRKATEADWKSEYNDMIISIKTVKDIKEAIRHINTYGSGHTDSIVTENPKAAEEFLTFVDSSSVMHNASTRFSDGYRYGFGAEVGISTGKLHARGPVGLEGLVTYKYLVKGDGHIVDDLVKGKKKFIHRKIK